MNTLNDFLDNMEPHSYLELPFIGDDKKELIVSLTWKNIIQKSSFPMKIESIYKSKVWATFLLLPSDKWLVDLKKFDKKIMVWTSCMNNEFFQQEAPDYMFDYILDKEDVFWLDGREKSLSLHQKEHYRWKKEAIKKILWWVSLFIRTPYWGENSIEFSSSPDRIHVETSSSGYRWADGVCYDKHWNFVRIWFDYFELDWKSLQEQLFSASFLTSATQ